MELKWHFCPQKWRALWAKLINRKDATKITDNTGVCSNYFVLGKPYGQYPHPSLYMRGYSGKGSHSENQDIQNIINSWSINTENSDEYLEQGTKPKMPLTETKTSIKRWKEDLISGDGMLSTDTQVALGDHDGKANADPNNILYLYLSK